MNEHATDQHDQRRPYCPWQHLGRLDGVDLTYDDLQVDGITNFRDRAITLRRGMTAAQRRSTLAHELAHLERGPVRGYARTSDGTPTTLAAHIEEHLVEGTAALRLVPSWILPEIPELTFRHGDAACRDILGIDQGTLLAIDALIAAVAS